MSFPGIIRRLFANNGAGPLLRGDIIPPSYGTCSTAAETAAKVVSLSGFKLQTGAEVTVRFTVTNTASSPTLNVNNTGAKAIRYRNAGINASHLAANRTYCFIYDGSYYQLVGDIDTNTTYTAASAAPKAPGTAAVGTSTKYAREDHVHPLQTTVSGSSGSCSGNSATATKLAAKRTIDGVSFDGSANIHHYGTCSTDAGTAAKTVTLANFVLATGAEVTVRFTVTNTASSPTLNVNNTGAKPIQYRNAAIAAGYLAANRTYRFVYDGSSYELVGDVDTNTTYTAATAAPKAPASSAAVGTSAKYAREDHVHPLQTTVSGSSGSCSGNSATATKLATKRTISLTGDVTGSADFDGSANAAIPASIPALVPVGGIVAFSGTFSGRNPVDMKSKKAMTSWCLCDGTTTNGLAVPDLRGRMILGASSTYAAGSKGGSATHTHSISGTVGKTTLSVKQLASHIHPIGVSSSFENAPNPVNRYVTFNEQDDNNSPSSDFTGDSQSHTHSFSGSSGSSNALPPYYALSYIMRTA